MKRGRGDRKNAGRRKPSYGAAGRLARIVFELMRRPRGWSLRAIENELRISERTAQRYVRVLQRELVDERERPLVELARQGDRRMLRLAVQGDGTGANAYEIASLYFSLSVLAFLEGTVLREGVEGVWNRLQRALSPRQQARLANAQLKFYTVPYTTKEYGSLDEELDTILRCLIDQHKMLVDYRGLLGEGKIHTVEPYTLVTYRGGLYLFGYSDIYRKIIPLAVERIAKVEKLDETFDYPKDYTPAKYTDGLFGIIEGPKTYVELLLLNAQTAALLKARRIHPTQRFKERRDGKTVLSMTVRGTTELANWILSLTPWVEVLRPPSLRREVARRLADAAKLYREGSRSATQAVRSAGSP